MQFEHSYAVARIHADALAGDFLPSLGVTFLHQFYSTVLTERLGFGYVYLANERVDGFILGSVDSSRLFRNMVIKRGIRLGLSAVPAVLRHPAILMKIIETFFYPSKESFVSEKAELMVIAIKPEMRGGGIGRLLVSSLSGEFRQRGIHAFKVTVLQANEGANRFYKKLGFILAGQFRLYSNQWNLYVYRNQ